MSLSHHHLCIADTLIHVFVLIGNKFSAFRKLPFIQQIRYGGARIVILQYFFRESLEPKATFENMSSSSSSIVSEEFKVLYNKACCSLLGRAPPTETKRLCLHPCEKIEHFWNLELLRIKEPTEKTSREEEVVKLFNDTLSTDFDGCYLISIHPKDRDFLKFFWQKDYEESKMKIYRDRRLAFGPSCLEL
ncbi:hypothetical protein TNCV_1876621 [Trichonephila clavipes]|nr:hypothetical protein TNCV_1876621 [Trichonephila clavipes]